MRWMHTTFLLSQKLTACILPDAGWSTWFSSCEIRLATAIFHAFKFRILSARLRRTWACLDTALLCTALTWDETCAGAYVRIPLKWLFQCWLGWPGFARRTKGIRFMVSESFSLMWVPDSLGLIFSYKGKKRGFYYVIYDWISALGLGIYFDSRFLYS